MIFPKCSQPYFFDVYNSSYGQNMCLLSCSPEKCLDEKLFSYYRRDMHLLSKRKCDLLPLNAMLLKTLMRMHSSHHAILYMSSYMHS